VAQGELAKGSGGAALRHRPRFGPKTYEERLQLRKGRIKGGNPKKKKKKRNIREDDGGFDDGDGDDDETDGGVVAGDGVGTGDGNNKYGNVALLLFLSVLGATAAATAAVVVAVFSPMSSSSFRGKGDDNVDGV